MRIGPDSPPPGGDTLDLGLFERHWFGDTTPEEVAAIEAWFQAHPERRAWYAQFGTGLGIDDIPALTASERARRTASILDAIDGGPPRLVRDDGEVRESAVPSARINRPIRIGHLDAGRMSWRRRFTFAGLAAAVVTLCAGLAWYLMAQASGRHHMTAGTSPASAPMREIVMRRGQRATFDLADGTRVYLAPESRLRIPLDYGAAEQEAREVSLSGEGYFVVRHDARRPFRVRTAVGIAEDIGTRFVVTAYPETPGMQVAVEEGAVALRRFGMAGAAPENPLLTLAAGDVAQLDNAGMASTMSGADLRSYVGWTRGELIFTRIRLAEVVQRLSRWYDLDIQVTAGLSDASGISETRRRALLDHRITASFTNEPATQVIRRLAGTLNLHVVRTGKRVVLAPAATSTPTP